MFVNLFLLISCMFSLCFLFFHFPFNCFFNFRTLAGFFMYLYLCFALVSSNFSIPSQRPFGFHFSLLFSPWELSSLFYDALNTVPLISFTFTREFEQVRNTTTLDPSLSHHHNERKVSKNTV